ARIPFLRVSWNAHCKKQRREVDTHAQSPCALPAFHRADESSFVISQRRKWQAANVMLAPLVPIALLIFRRARRNQDHGIETGTDSRSLAFSGGWVRMHVKCPHMFDLFSDHLASTIHLWTSRQDPELL